MSYEITLWADPGVWFSHKLHALKVEPLLALFTLNHVSVITFRESTYAVNMNECMLLPTFLNRPFCRGEGCKLFILKTLFKVSSHFICIPVGVAAIVKIAMYIVECKPSLFCLIVVFHSGFGLTDSHWIVPF